MIFSKHLSVTFALLLSSIGLTSGNAYAESDLFADAPFLTSQNSIYVQEIPGRYQITNKSGQEIFMFGVTNSDAQKAYSEEGSYFTRVDSEYYSYWQGQTITKAEWDTRDGQFGAFRAADGGGAGSEMYRLTSKKLGTFESLFGTEDTSVNIYWHIQGSDINPFTSGTLNQFYWTDSLPQSQVTVFGISGQILSTSVTAAVPEPETYAMFMAGLGLLGFASRRRKA